MDSNTPSSTPISLTDIFDLAKALENVSAIPAAPIMTLLNNKVGLRRAKLTYVLIPSALMLAPGIATSNIPLIVGGLVVGGVGYAQNWRAWRAICEGKGWHTFSDGKPWISYLRLPSFLYKEERIERFVNPAIGYALSAVISAVPVARPLAGLLALSTVFLALHAQLSYDWRLDRVLDGHDAQEDALAMNAWLKQLRDQKKGIRPANNGSGQPLPTGIGGDIRGQIEKRRNLITQVERENKAYVISEDMPVTALPTSPSVAEPVPLVQKVSQAASNNLIL